MYLKTHGISLCLCDDVIAVGASVISTRCVGDILINNEGQSVTEALGVGLHSGQDRGVYSLIRVCNGTLSPSTEHLLHHRREGERDRETVSE